MRTILIAVFSLTTLTLIVVSSGCGDRTLRPLTPCTVSGITETVSVDAVDSVDLLFVIDDSGSMGEEQGKLKAEIPELVRILVTGDYNNNGMKDEADNDFEPVQDLNVGIVRTDMGNNGQEQIGNCAPPMSLGDGPGLNGVIIRDGNDNILNFKQGDDSGAFITAIEGQVDALDTKGCGIEQQLEAMAKAVAPSTHAIFRRGTGGHADIANSGFLRDNSALAIIIVTDEEDCSTESAYPFMVSAASTANPPRQNFLCTECALGDAAGCSLYPAQRYVDSLIETSGKPPQLIVFGAIVGTPEVGGMSKYASDDFAGILGDSAMAYEEISEMQYETAYPMGGGATGQQVRPVCGPNGGMETIAAPGRRYVEFAQALSNAEGIAAVHSICADSFRPAVTDIAEKIASTLNGLCLGRELNPGQGGDVPCDILIEMPLGTACSTVPGVEPDPASITPEGNEVCRGIQLIPVNNTKPTGDGWYYDDFSPDLVDCPPNSQQRITFTNQDATAPSGASISLECLQPVQGANGTVTVGTACAGNAAICGQAPDILAGSGENSTFPYQLQCNAATNTCEAPCDQSRGDADCPGGYVCFKPEGLSFPSIPGSINDVGICVNPTCVS